MFSTLQNDVRPNLSTAIDKLVEGDFNDAIAICHNLIATEPENHQLAAKAHLVAGRAYLFLGWLEDAERELKTGIQLDVFQAPGYIDLGYVYLRRKLRAEAIGYLRKAQQCPDINTKVRLTLAVAWLQARQYGEAYYELENLLTSCDRELPRAGLQILRGIAWYGKSSMLHRLLVLGPFMIVIMLPLTQVGAWVSLTLLTLGALFVLQRAQLLRAGALPLVFSYALMTSLFLLSVIAF